MTGRPLVSGPNRLPCPGLGARLMLVADAAGGEGLLGEPEAARLHQITEQGADDEGGRMSRHSPAAPKVAQQPAKVPGM